MTEHLLTEHLLGEHPLEPGTTVYPEGWQSWSPATWYDATAPAGFTGHRPETTWQHLMRYRPGVGLPQDGVQAEGLLVVAQPSGVTVYGAAEPARLVPTLRARVDRDRLVVTASEGVTVTTFPGGGESAGLDALRAWGRQAAAGAGVTDHRPPPRVWCTWYRYFEAVTATDVEENVTAFDQLGLGVDLVQIDDGWAAGTGDWLAPRPEFGDLAELVARVRDGGRRVGIWLAPFIAGADSDLVRRNPGWVSGPAGYNWGQDQVGLDPTAPGLRDFLGEQVSRLAELGVDYLKLDFLYAGALPRPGVDHAQVVADYRAGLAALREAAGAEAYLVGCGAPILPSLGLVDAMRVSPDVFHEGDEDGSAGLRGRLSAEGRRWQNEVLWTADPDCLVVRPSYAMREEWSEVVAGYGGLLSWSDRVAELDEWGLARVREILGGAR